MSNKRHWSRDLSSRTTRAYRQLRPRESSSHTLTEYPISDVTWSGRSDSPNDNCAQGSDPRVHARDTWDGVHLISSYVITSRDILTCWHFHYIVPSVTCPSSVSSVPVLCHVSKFCVTWQRTAPHNPTQTHTTPRATLLLRNRVYWTAWASLEYCDHNGRMDNRRWNKLWNLTYCVLGWYVSLNFQWTGW